MVQIKVEGFDGPLDLLLDLIEHKKLDITALSLAEVADQYWREIDGAEEGLDADTLAEFIAVGSKLLYVKSCALLPSAEPPAGDLRERIDEAAGELTDLLEEHKRFKDAVDLFRQLEEEGRRTFARAAPVKNVLLPPGLEGVTLDTLLAAVKEALARRPPEAEEAVLHVEPVTVNEKMEEITRSLARGRGRLPFRPLLAGCQTRTEIVVLFLAVLELIKSGRLWADQPEPFGEIELMEAAAEPA
ncbi:MAG: ScpA family protein [Dehalococcoidia bacterium]|nr:ScpA family protein [Dehalococcoidia bacterium]